ncbi:MAG: hypothetical protein IT446_07590 [Phycisphaerales bacterium]|jgi:uroporphyrinogen decarboxylase|nr:hypothetical protein [Phycisphaerales bacterium]
MTETDTTMTPRERWHCLFDGRRPDRIPTDYQATKEVTARLLSELDCADLDSLFQKLDIDGRRIIEPRYIGPLDKDHPDRDYWGVGLTSIPYETGAYTEATYNPLAGAESPADVKAHRWPNPDDFNYAEVADILAADDGRHVVQGGRYEPFLLYVSLRGMEQAYEDLLCNPDIADAILGRLFEVHYEINRRIFEAGRGRIDLTYIAEDLGSQSGPLMSLEVYRRFLLPNQIRMADLARQYGIHIMYHTDGAARIFLPDLIDRVGIELLNPIQWRCPGMDREGLARDFGDRVIFHGSIENQQTLPFGTTDEVKREVRQARKIFEHSRWICGPCHNIQPITPTANILAMYQSVNE